MPSNASFAQSLRGYTYTFVPGVEAMPIEPTDPPTYPPDRAYTVSERCLALNADELGQRAAG